jgi:hypothetical protein
LVDVCADVIEVRPDHHGVAINGDGDADACSSSLLGLKVGRFFSPFKTAFSSFNRHHRQDAYTAARLFL